MIGLTLVPEGSGSLAKLLPLHELLQLRSGCPRGYRISENRWEVDEISILCKVYLVSVSHYWDTLSDTVCQFVSEVEDYSLCGYCHSLDIVEMKQLGQLSLKWLSPTCSYQSIIIHTQCYATSQGVYITHCMLWSVFSQLAWLRNVHFDKPTYIITYGTATLELHGKQLPWWVFISTAHIKFYI